MENTPLFSRELAAQISRFIHRKFSIYALEKAIANRYNGREEKESRLKYDAALQYKSKEK